MVKNLKGGKKHKKIKRVDKNCIPKDIFTHNYIIAKVNKIHNRTHVSVKTMDGKNIEDIFCSINNSVRFVKLDDLVLIYKYNTEYHIKNTNQNEKKKSIIVTLLDTEKLNKLINEFHYPFIDQELLNEDCNIIFENEDTILNQSINEDEIDIDNL